MIKQIRSASILLAVLVLAAAIPRAEAQTYVWDGSTTSGYQNTDGTWGVDSFWTTNTGAGSGTVLNAWSNNAIAWLGGNATVAGTPSGDFTITVSGTQVATQIRQIQNGAGNFTLQGGEIQANSFRADTNTLTINSVIGSYTNAANARVDFSAQPAAGTLLILGGNNTLTNAVGIAGASGGGGTVRLNHQNALGLGDSVTWTHNTLLDLNGYSVSNKTLTVNSGRTGFLDNTAATKSVWSGNVQLTNGTGVLRAGGTVAEVEISGIISGTNGLQTLDNGTLRLSGANTYDGLTSVRNGSTLIVDNASALGSTTSGTTINNAANTTLDLNGFNVGNEAITLVGANSRLVNNNTSSAATVAGSITTTNGQIGGSGNLTASGVLSSATATGFTKVGTGTVTLSGNNTYTGTTTVSNGVLALATNGSLRFVIGASGTNNAILGTGTTTMNGRFAFDLTGASTNTNATWTIVAGTLTNSYGTNFLVTGFNGAGGRWTNTTNGVSYVFAQSNGVLSVQPASSVTPYNAWVAYWQTNSAGFTNTAGTDNPDGDPFDNNEEFAFDGNPTVGSPALLTATMVGTNTVFNYVALTNTNAATYAVQSTTNLTTGWTNAAVTVSNSLNQSNISQTNSYTRKEFTVPASGSAFYRVQASILP
jgi:autotransporter-associated beta strand protein